MTGIAYSYVRFSTPEQKEGNSLVRQLEKTRKWADENGFELDDTMRDEGLSGYHGKHLAATAHLGNFLTRIKAGEIAKGSVLIVEHLDRLGRDDVEDALARFIDIKSHVDIVTLMDGQRYAKGDHWSKLMIAIVSMATANEESAKKAERTADNWRRVRGTTSALAPSWIIRTRTPDGKPNGFKVDEKKAAIVRRLFTMVLTDGMTKIAGQLNAEKVPTMTGRTLTNGRTVSVWDQNSIKNIVRSRKALGEQSIGKYTDGKRADTGESIIGAYPAIIDEATWYAAQQALDGRCNGGHSALKGRNVGQVRNIFGGLARCALCDNRMTVATRGRGTHFYLGCSMAKTGKCPAKKFHRLDGIEAAVIKFFGEAAVTAHDKPEADPASALQSELDAASAQLARLATRRNAANDERLDDPSDTIKAQDFNRVDGQFRDQVAKVKKLEGQVAAKRASKPATDQFATVRRLLTALDTLTGAERLATRAKVAQALPGIVKALRFQPDGRFNLTMVDDLPASLPNTPAAKFVRAYWKVGAAYEFEVTGKLAPRTGKLGSIIPDTLPAMLLTNGHALPDHMTVLAAT